jgi:hypothetical protein
MKLFGEGEVAEFSIQTAKFFDAEGVPLAEAI